MASIPASRNPAEDRSVAPDVEGAAPPCADAALDPEMTSAVVEHGLLMVFGPDGDPLPPEAFAAAAADRPDAGVPVGTGARVPACQVAAVLEAQSTARLATGDDEANAWIEAMLGLGPQPTSCTPSELRAEDGACEIALTGEDIRIDMADGASLLIAPADLERSADARYRLTGRDGTPISFDEMLGRLREEMGKKVEDEGAVAMLPGCSLAWDDQTLVLGAGSIGFRLAPAAGAPPDQDAVDLLSPGREALAPGDLALAVRASAFDPEHASFEESGGAPPEEAPAAAEEAELRGLPGSLVLGPDGVLDLGCLAAGVAGLRTPVASIVVSGLPDAAMLSAGGRDESGAWRLAAEELPGLTLFAIAERLGDFRLAFTFRTAHGELERSLRIEVERATAERLPAASGETVAVGGDPDAPLPPPQAQSLAAEPFGRAEMAMVIVAGLPPGAILSSGIDNGDGSWSVAADAPAEIGVALPAGHMQAHRLVLTAVGIGGRDGGIATMSREIVLVPGQPIRLSVLDGDGPDRKAAALPLDLRDLVGDLAGAAKPDAVVISGLPDGASLSQGVHDEAIASWVLRPNQLAGLMLSHIQAGPCELKVTVVAIDRATGKPHARTRRLDLDVDNPPGQASSCRPAGGVGFFRPLGNRRGLM